MLLGGVLFPDEKHPRKKGLAIGRGKAENGVRLGAGLGSDCFHLMEKRLGNQLEVGKGKGKSHGTIHIENVGARVYFEMNEFFHLLSFRFL